LGDQEWFLILLMKWKGYSPEHNKVRHPAQNFNNPEIAVNCTGCYNDECNIHLSENMGYWFPQGPRYYNKSIDKNASY